jgi:hypothetical protein
MFMLETVMSLLLKPAHAPVSPVPIADRGFVR